MAGHARGATVSTLAEADWFFSAGIDDLLYAVGIAPGGLDAVAERIRAGMRPTLVLDHPDAAPAIQSRRSGGFARGCRWRKNRVTPAAS